MIDSHPERRILIVDDNEAVHDDIRKVLAPKAADSALDALTAQILGRDVSEDLQSQDDLIFRIDSAYQGQDAVQMVLSANAENKPYEMAFVDMRMPPGWDGVETIERIWKVDNDIQIVICTAYSDYSLAEISSRLGRTDRLLVIKKPFDSVEVCQAAVALVEKWRLAQQVNSRIAQLVRMNERLETEIAKRRSLEKQLRHDAIHDTLTSLPNRAVILEDIERCIKRCKRSSEYMFAVLFLDVDEFKVVNDSLGHSAGDDLLVEISNRLVDCLRDLDTMYRPSDETTARLGGDEFVILLDGIQNVESAGVVAERLRRHVSRPLDVRGRVVKPTISIGIAVGDSNYDTPEDILSDADTALYKAKNLGKDREAFFAVHMRDQVMERLQVRSDLDMALSSDQFRLDFQPIVCLSSGAIDGVEALVRWHHPVRGIVSPANFIPLAEEMGLIHPIGRWVLEEACRQVADWHRNFDEFRSLAISVNVSSKQLDSDEIIEAVECALKQSGIDPFCLKIELTESLILAQNKTIDARLAALKSLGIAVHMDDFGTGYSSLSNMGEQPFDAVKLDRSFIAPLGEDAQKTATVGAIIKLVHGQNRVVIAEGVETRDQLVKLQELGCDFGQGYYFSRAVDPRTVSTVLESGGHWLNATRPLFVSECLSPVDFV